MRRVLPLKIALASLFIAACVTINVYFPAAAADKAAGQYIDEVMRGGSGGTEQKSTTPPQSSLAPAHRDEDSQLLARAFGDLLVAMVPAAHAQNAEAAINISTPASQRIKSSMGARFADLEKFFASGAIGLTKDGLVEVRDLNSVALPDRATVKRLVAEENSDRGQLYTEIARASNHPEWEGDIRKSFAKQWIEKAKAGWYYQGDDGSWKQK
jgi:uncharacterized protein